MTVAPWIWIAFLAFILAMLLADLFIFHRQAHKVTMREAAWTSAFWIFLGLVFGVIVWWWQGPHSAGEYLAGYLIEKSLSVDNIFVFALIFSYFSVPAEFQHRLLFWGVLGALVFRAVFIAGGAALLENFHWMIYVFGGFLVFTGIRMAWHKNEEIHPERNPVLSFVRRVLPMTSEYEGQKFFVRKAGKLMATPLLAVLVVVETTDVIFAVDSIPAIFAVTRDTFLVYTSNAFAILGLRALYFLLAGMIERFTYLKIGLSAILVYVGIKMLVSEFYKINPWVSLSVIVAVLTVSVIASLRSEGREIPDEKAEELQAGARKP
ncbi:MAG TPA: TerC family protein [Actinomycetota bacterium]|jgi:tellurite resistance protein TerC|nr:TerC family protein [Actinomycetota bacterium]